MRINFFIYSFRVLKPAKPQLCFKAGPSTSVNYWRLPPVETGHPGLTVDGARVAAAEQVRRSSRDNAKPGTARAPRPQWPVPGLTAPLRRERQGCSRLAPVLLAVAAWG